MQPKDFYQEQINETSIRLSKAKRLSLTVSLSRLAVFLLTVFLAYVLRSSNLALGITIILGFTIFLVLLSLYTNLKRERTYAELLIKLNKDELDGLNGNFEPFNAGKEYAQHLHAYSEDMDLFGKGSLFQSINRSATVSGEQKLADLLGSNNMSTIFQKQETIRELAEKPSWRQSFRVNAGLIEVQTEPDKIIAWLKNYQPKLSKKIGIFALVFSGISLTVLLLATFSILSWTMLLIPLLMGLLISGIFLGKVNKINEMATRLSSTFQQYAKLLESIESENFKSEWLQEKRKNIQSHHRKASLIFSDLGKDLNSLDQRKNIFFALFANGFTLWDLRFSVKIENWILINEKVVEICFETIAFFDAYNSLSNYAFNHPNHIYPALIDDGNITIRSKDLGHPLLKSEKRISNDLMIKDDEFFIITGANMAGKSTFLRTVGISILMSNAGLPICAKEFLYKPVKLISSMRSSDSLYDDESYFFAELKRLRYIVDQLKMDRYFIILDEILKGTNSKDKEDGSKKFVERLVYSKSTGIIATHDLSLCKLESELPQIKNYYFDAEIVNDELHFDYKMKQGICKNMNASFLLKKMGIIS